MIPHHLRENHERTDQKLNELRGLIAAAYIVGEDRQARVDGTPESDALTVLNRLAWAKIEEIEKARSMEWAGIGGSSPRLTNEEIGKARGKARGADHEPGGLSFD